MSINRHNYETFFLLYVDSELSPAEMKSVEFFVESNPDLEPELRLLAGTKLMDEKIHFDSPELLYKNKFKLDKLNEQLLLHLDNELDEVAAKEFAGVLKSDKLLKKEWDLFLQTKLDAGESIEFRDKQLLYRHEKEGIFFIRFRRTVAIAATLFLVFLTGIAVFRKSRVEKIPVAINQINTNKAKDPVIITTQPTSLPSAALNTPRDAHLNQDEVKPENEQKAIQKVTFKGKNELNPAINNSSVARNAVEKSNINNKTSLENINSFNSNEPGSSNVLPSHKSEIVLEKVTPADVESSVRLNPPSKPLVPLMDNNSVSAIPDQHSKSVSLNEGVAVTNNKIFFMNEETITRSKAAGLFRKVKRIIEQNTNIKTANGIRIGGYEIALN